MAVIDYYKRWLGAGFGKMGVAKGFRQAIAARRLARWDRYSRARSFAWALFAFFALTTAIFPLANAHAQEAGAQPADAIVVRTTENVTEGAWAWILEESKAAGITRIDVLVKQDEDNFKSRRTGRKLQSGELLVALPGETTAVGWENSDWLVDMLARARELEIEIWAWWPAFHDAQTAALYPSARYTGGDGSVFVDAAVPGVRDRQEELINKLLKTYDFDGVSLDWLRYDNWADGTTGPLAEKFLERTGTRLGDQRMKDPAARAIWGDLRATSIADWVARLVDSSKSSQPGLKWGAYLLPPQFKEVSQNYGYLTQAGLGYVQPMIYWDLWGNPPEWSGEVVGQRPFWLNPGSELVPTLDLNRPESETIRSFEAIGDTGVSGFLWYLDTTWKEEHFDKIKRIRNRWREARAVPARVAEIPMVDRLPSADFPLDSSAWTLVLLSELYDQGVLSDSDPVIPVLALHRFVEGSEVHGPSTWANSSAYIDRLVTFLADREFSVIPLSRLQAYMVGGAIGDLPPRPLVLTVDDGAHSVLKYFHPKAREHQLPYSLSVITSPLSPDEAHLDDHTRTDRQMDWNEVQQLVESGLVELVSHSHTLHTYVPQAAGAGSRMPSAIAHMWLGGQGRQETSGERYRRVLKDLSSSRQELMVRFANPVSILAWPYGRFDETSERAAREAGFTHFLLFGGSRFATTSWTAHRIARIPITREDETIPLELPGDHLTAQRWWLAFLEFARQTASAQLIEESLVQLDNERARHPEAELSRAALDLLRGRPETALRRIRGLEGAYPNDLEVNNAITTFREIYKRVL